MWRVVNVLELKLGKSVTMPSLLDAWFKDLCGRGSCWKSDYSLVMWRHSLWRHETLQFVTLYDIAVSRKISSFLTPNWLVWRRKLNFIFQNQEGQFHILYNIKYDCLCGRRAGALDVIARSPRYQWIVLSRLKKFVAHMDKRTRVVNGIPFESDEILVNGDKTSHVNSQ